jgi:lipopolysaccharide export system protein LptC
LSDNFHSQLVGWAKIILPLSALALLSTLFLFARQPGQDPEIPFAEIETLARDQRISSPQFSGVTTDGSVIAITANNAQPDQDAPNLLLVESLDLSLDGADGSRVDVTSGMSVIDSLNRTAKLQGLARLTTSSGYVMETNGLSADLNSGEITSEGALEIQAPFGQITAGRIKITLSETGEGQQMLFTDGVKLLYTPNNALSVAE